MNWDAVGAIAESIGALGVILTLIYLSTQVRQNTAQMRNAAKDVRLDSFDRTIETFSRHREYLTRDGNADLYARGLESYEGLSVAEKIRFCAIIEEYFFAFQGLYLRVLEDRYDRSLWRSQMRGAAALIKSTGGKEWWEDRRYRFTHGFISETETIAAELAD